MATAIPDVAGPLLDAATEFLKFCAYKDAIPSYVAAAFLPMAAGAFLLLLTIAMARRDRRRKRKLGLDRHKEPGTAFTSRDGLALRIYPEGCVLERAGADVSGTLSGILGVSRKIRPEGTFLLVSVEDGPKEGLPGICCGKLEDGEYEELRERMLRYAGG